MNRRLPLALAAALVMGLAGCSADPAPADPAPIGPSSPAEPAPSASPAAAVSAAGLDLGHVHNLALDGGAVLMGTHAGLYRQEPGQAPVRVGDPFDVMGLAVAPGRLLASGHPAPGSSGPGDLGLLASTDGGATWNQVTLSGEVDFHRISASGTTVLGVNSGDGMLWRSEDDGINWTTPSSGPFDVALNPGDEMQAVATTASGPSASSDGGLTFAPLIGAPLIAFVAWTSDGLVAATPDGAVLRSTDAGLTWTPAGSLAGAPSALAADEERVVALQGGTLWESTDGGASFTPRITGLPD